ncbi:NAD(P)H-dependent oxidoreductase [Leucobacter sp. CSA1]|uniref:FMN dependent NADH:quinone oxidoreductase n=1 Tax=Leucobacter chromiisoli TaxID=2796471 RepID=A0A934UTH5_9MICO|nr:NAD(P)H-dependent oxidoreductase [Leucobacter chromiisoli]MBK0417710.1 NAD(P)H-dependent oxidoreductase [Leucobacter chromiisoli]
MPTLLHIDSSASGEHSVTRMLTGAFAETWRARGDDHTVVARDLHEDPVPHLRTAAQHWPEHLRGGAEIPRAAATLQDRLIDEAISADVLVVGAPMYNYGMPSTLKTWLDLLHVPGRTAPFDTATQPLRGKPVIVVSARGGTDDDGAFEHVFGPLRLALGGGLGMELRTIGVRRTLASLLPELGADLAAAELSRATAEIREIAAAIAAAPGAAPAIP